jgi:hypothetical protein
MGITSASVQVAPDATERRLLNKEDSFGRHLLKRTGVHPSTHWRQIFSAAKYLDGLMASSTELNKMEGCTASSTELSLMHGVTATTTELNYTDGIAASTGNVVKFAHIPWKSTLSQLSRSTVASSPGLKCVIMSTGLSGPAPTLTIPASRFGLSKIIAVQTQIASTRAAWSLTDTYRHVDIVVPSILQNNSTVVIRQYCSASLGTPGSVVVSTGECHLQVFAYGWA